MEILNCASQAGHRDICGFNHLAKNFSSALKYQTLLVLAQENVSHP